jgi:hypothetical protein
MMPTFPPDTCTWYFSRCKCVRTSSWELRLLRDQGELDEAIARLAVDSDPDSRSELAGLLREQRNAEELRRIADSGWSAGRDARRELAGLLGDIGTKTRRSRFGAKR